MSASSTLRPFWKTISARAPNVPPVKRTIESIKAALPRKVGMHKQPRVFHSPNTQPRRHITLTPPIAAPKTKDPILDLTTLQLAILDPTGARQKLFSRANRDAINVGDILQVRRRNGEQPFAGVLIDIRRRGVDTGFLLRGQVTRIGVEVWFKLYSPNIEGIDVVQRSVKRARRAKLYYMRKPEHDLGSVQNIVNQYTRTRAMLRGNGNKGGAGGAGAAATSKGKKGKK